MLEESIFCLSESRCHVLVRSDTIVATAETIKERFPECEIRFWDERFTTTIAQQALLEADVSRSGRKKKVDKIAATLLLQSYLDSGRNI